MCNFVKGMEVIPSRAFEAFCRCEQTWARLTRDMAEQVKVKAERKTEDEEEMRRSADVKASLSRKARAPISAHLAIFYALERIDSNAIPCKTSVFLLDEFRVSSKRQCKNPD